MIVDLFAGAGGWEEGLTQLGIRQVVGLETDDDACHTAWSAGHLRIQADVTTYTTGAFAGATGLIASPPCQDWSAAGRRSDGGTRQLTNEVIRWATDLRPEWVVCEQVRDVLPVWRDYAQQLAHLGYRSWCGIVDAANFGVPQHRQRAILIATRNDDVDLQPVATHARQHTLTGERPWLTMNDAVGWHGQLDRRQDAPIIGTDRPAPTVTGVSIGAGQWLYRPSGGEWRQVTLEEGAQLQSFRNDYPWQGNKRSRGQQIGNAVPPVLAAAVMSLVVNVEVPA